VDFETTIIFFAFLTALFNIILAIFTFLFPKYSGNLNCVKSCIEKILFLEIINVI